MATVDPRARPGGSHPGARRAARSARRPAPSARESAAATAGEAPRARVSLSSSRRVVVSNGGGAARDVLDAFEQTRDPRTGYPRWLDFGCAPGAFSRYLVASPHVAELWGADLDGEAVGWASRYLRGRYVRIEPDPPTPSPADWFDVVYAGSVFTHLDERRQIAWIRELHRLLRSSRLLIASTHAPALASQRPDLPAARGEELDRVGFLFAPGGGPFSEDSAFHSSEYLIRTWGRFFGLDLFRPMGLNAFQDLAVWRKW